MNSVSKSELNVFTLDILEYNVQFSEIIGKVMAEEFNGTDMTACLSNH